MQVGDDLRVAVRPSCGVVPDRPGEREKAHALRGIDVQHAVVRSGAQAGVEAAPVIAPVADAKERVLPLGTVVPDLHRHALVDAL